MNKNGVVNRMKLLDFPKDSYVVFGSAPFAVLGIREVNDIDLLVSEELYAELEKNGWKKVNKGPKIRLLLTIFLKRITLGNLVHTPLPYPSCCHVLLK